MKIEITPTWRSTFREASVGILWLRAVSNPAEHAGLEARKDSWMKDVRARYENADPKSLSAIPEIAAYDAYFKRFKKTYTVKLQLESVVFKGKSLPATGALVEAMFLSEMQTGLLTAGHDVAALRPPLRVEASTGEERYTLLRGDEQALKPGDMYMADEAGVIANVIYGPDSRTRIGPETREALFVTYAPAGVSPLKVREQLEGLRELALLVSPEGQTELLEVYTA